MASTLDALTGSPDSQPPSAGSKGKDTSEKTERKKAAEKALGGLSNEELLEVLGPEALPEYIQRDKLLELKKAKGVGKSPEKIEKLREDYEKAAKEKDEDLKKRVLERFKEIRERVAKEALTLPDVSNVEDLDKVLLQAQKGLEAVYEAILKGIQRGSLSAAVLIDNHQILYGRYVDAGVSRIAHGGELVCRPDDCERTLRSADQVSTELTLKHSSTSSYAQMDSAINQYGWSWLASAEASGVAFIGDGIGAASAAFRLQRAGEESRASSQSNATTRTMQINSRYVFVPKAVLVLDTKDLTLSPAAGKSLSEIKKLDKDDPRRKELIMAFYENFGTHVSAATTLGGLFRLRAKAESSTAQQRSQPESTVASATEWAAAVTACYAGTWAAGAKTAEQHTERTDSSNINKLFYAENELTVEIETSVKGGEPGLPVDMWRQALQYNSTWAVINRDELYPVWKLINDTLLAPEFEKVWVQEILAKSLTGLPEAVTDYISKNAKSVAELKKCLDDLAPRVELRVFRDSFPIPKMESAGYHGELEVKVQDGYKLIGGGARVYPDNEDGNFLTASYPKDKVTWEARCKDHGAGHECGGSLEVWAVGL